MQSIKEYIEGKEGKKLYIIRGLPGSGKSTLARKISPDHTYEADDFFLDDEGNYNFDLKKVNQAHDFCIKRVRNDMKMGISPICVSNTFTRKKEYAIYLEMAKRYGYEYEIKICDGRYKNIHNVKDEVIEMMRKRFEY